MAFERTQPEQYRGMMAIQVSSAERMAFIRKVYSLFSLALVLFAGTTWWACQSEFALRLIMPLLGGGILKFLLLMLLMFGMLRLAMNRFPINIFALGAFAFFMGLMTGPLVTMALAQGGVEVVAQAAVLTTVVFGGLTLYALTSKTDFSFLRAGLWIGFSILIGFLLLGWLFGFNTGGWGVSAGFVLLMSGFVLYDTSNIMRRYPTTAAVPAAIALFLDFVIMFQHILRLLSRRD
ncbi:MAG: Bax inhibitor-1 family protein [Planctomycetota bacterium]|jgi:hypothetical protein|nr:Bax inhibitor-1 family protein [Planctomycetota bacterium]MDP6941177.1 Bax inhibitor-1 family protein [Planctomycetota bacterium]